jgi:Domain of unknown function (DUF1841)
MTEPPSAVGGLTREQLRQSYADAWRKHRARSPLTPLESMIVEVIERHPEYRPVVEDLEAAAAFETQAGGAAENPFLHMGLHLAVREQLAIDRPPGIRDLHHTLQARLGDAHGAEHALMEALAETLWQAQRDGRAPDETHYLQLARRRAASVRPRG